MSAPATHVGPAVAGQAVRVQFAEREVAVARFAPDGIGGVDVSCHVEAGHLPVGIRRRLVDAIFAAPAVRSCEQIRFTIPLGDTALLRAIEDHCPDLLARAAGATCLIDVSRR